MLLPLRTLAILPFALLASDAAQAQLGSPASPVIVVEQQGPFAHVDVRFTNAFRRCESAVTSRHFDATGARACRTAADVATSNPGSNLVEQRRAQVYAALALAATGMSQQALPYANTAVAAVAADPQTTARDAESAFLVRAQVRRTLGDHAGAAQDAAQVVDYARRMLSEGYAHADARLTSDLSLQRQLTAEAHQVPLRTGAGAQPDRSQPGKL